MSDAHSRDRRGMVTAELALGAVAVVMITVVLAWGLHLVTSQLLLEDTVAEVARQAARGDRAAVASARSDAPPGTRLEVLQESGALVVRAELDSGPPTHPRAVVLTAEARVIAEPGTPVVTGR
ncbi:hypothetical protein GA0111570_10363 [Raineyella antarctica]|uniref:TadE-like protein n=1 Tax=Raineyella antarctica TaxID=1577474 RepID=A0A1G6GFJ9_9ACTN|nr:TadE family type IV pilus minor pilin [Raineyella antarctica]SDB80744.1 hypothetical protein GA0111570_10363 [Raineyella antarctica]